jgi:tetratricopeptide (TPR) repeat protein
LGIVCALVIGLLAWMAGRHGAEFAPPPPAAEHYNLLTEGFRAGQLSLKREIPPGLRQLADPYDPVANAVYRSPPVGLHDTSYFRGRLYLYFGPVPAVVLFWPWAALTGHHLPERYAVVIFCALGFLAAAWLLRALWRRYFPDVGVGVVAAGLLALGLATGVPVMLQRPSFYEVPISCAYALLTLALAAVWKALHEPERRGWWLVAASLAYGLALGSRPSVLFGAVILLVPVVATAGPGAGAVRRWWRLLPAAVVPITVIGLVLLLYNQRRFGHPFEFGQRFQLAGDRQAQVQHFSLGYLWFNLRLYFLAPMRWTRAFPFVDEPAVPPLPAGHVDVVEFPVAILTNIPLIWLALAAPLAWRHQPPEARLRLRWFLAAVAALFVTGAAVIALFYTTSTRYEVEFLPPLVFLAAVGILGVERALARAAAAGQADRPRWRRPARCGWITLLVLSVTLNLLASVGRYAEKCYGAAALFLRAGQLPAAVEHFERALRFKPTFPRAHADLAIALTRQGNLPAAIDHLQQALQLDPRAASARINLATLFAMTGRLPDAVVEYRQTLQLDPDNEDAHANLGNALLQLGRLPEAISEYRAALRLRPDDAMARAGLERAEALQRATGPWR